MGHQQAGVLDSLMPIKGGKYGIVIGQGYLGLIVFDSEGQVWAQATAPLQSDIINLTEPQQTDRINKAAVRAAHLINGWDTMAKAASKALGGIDVRLEEKFVFRADAA